MYVAGSRADRRAPLFPPSRLQLLTPPRARTDTSVSNKYVAVGAGMALALGLLVARFSGPTDYSYEGAKPLSEYVRLFSSE